MHDMTDDERSALTPDQMKFADTVERLGNGYTIETYRIGYSYTKPAVRVEDQQELMDVLAGLTEDGVDIRKVSFDGCGQGYLIYHK